MASATTYRIFWDDGLPGSNGKCESWPCGWCWDATDESEEGGEIIGSGTLGASGRPSAERARKVRSLVRELRADVCGTRLPVPPVDGWTWAGREKGYEITIK